jgi:hypothetical protein
MPEIAVVRPTWVICPFVGKVRYLLSAYIALHGELAYRSVRERRGGHQPHPGISGWVCEAQLFNQMVRVLFEFEKAPSDGGEGNGKF